MFHFCPFCAHKISEQSKNGFQCSKCKKWTHYASNPAVSIAVKVGKEGLIAVRGREPGKGKHDLVGGFLEYGEDPQKGAVREFKEETGIQIDADKLKLMGIWIGDYYYQNQENLILNIIYLIELPEKFIGYPADDVADLMWKNLNNKPNFAFNYLHQVWKKIGSTHRVCAE